MRYLGSPITGTVALATGDLGDDIVTLAKIASGTDGELITWDASGNPAAVGAGTSGHFLKSQGAGSVPVFAEAGGGKVLQVLGASKTDVASTTSTSMADTGLSVAITPAATSSKILVTGHAVFGTDGNNHYFFAQFVRDSTALGVGDAASSRIRANFGQGVDNNSNNYASGFSFLDSPSSTSELTYKLQFRSQTGSIIYLNRSTGDSDSAAGGRYGSSIVVMEIGA